MVENKKIADSVKEETKKIEPKKIITDGSEFEALKKEIEELKKELDKKNDISSVLSDIEIITDDEDAKYKHESKMVSGIFRYYEIRGGLLKFTYRKYKKDGPIQSYEFKDGEEYTIPLHLALHLNSSGWYAVHVESIDANGMPTERVGSKIHRYGFQSKEFIEGLEPPREIVEEAI